MQRQCRVIVPHDRDTRLIAVAVGSQRDGRLHRERAGLRHLRQHIRHVPQQTFAAGAGQNGQRQCTVFGGVPFFLWVCLPLPLDAETFGKVVIRGQLIGGVHLWQGQRPALDRLADAVTVLLQADERPILAPCHGLQMQDAAIDAVVLEVEEPVLARGRVDPRALMGAVGAGIALMQNDFLLIGAEGAARAERHLPARADATRRRKDVVPAVALIKLRAFHRGVHQLVVEHLDPVVQQAACVWGHAADIDAVLDATAALGVGVGHVGVAVVVPERAGVDPAAGLLDAVQLTPRACGIFRSCDKNAFVGQRGKDIEHAVMVADGRGPRAAAVGGQVVAGKGQLFDAPRQLFPVDEVSAVQQRHTGQVGKAGRHHVVILPHADDIGVAVVHVQHGISVILAVFGRVIVQFHSSLLLKLAVDALVGVVGFAVRIF